MRKKQDTGPPPVVATSEEEAAYKAFHDNGDLIALAAFADKADEMDRRHFARLLREVAAAANPSIHWFYTRVPFAWVPHLETKCQGRLAYACRQAWWDAVYHRKIKDELWRGEWSEEHWIEGEHPGDAEPDEWKRLYGFTIYDRRGPDEVWSQDGHAERVIGHLGGIDLGDGSPDDTPPPDDCRIFQAQVAEGAIFETGETVSLPEWMCTEKPLRRELVVLRLVPWGSRNFPAFMRNRVVALLPESPAPMAANFEDSDFAECYVIDGEKLIEGAHTSAAVVKCSYPVKDDFWKGVADKLLREKGIEPVFCPGLRRGHLGRLRKRREEMQRLRDAAAAGPMTNQ
jgi:hypothetical protein